VLLVEPLLEELPLKLEVPSNDLKIVSPKNLSDDVRRHPEVSQRFGRTGDRPQIPSHPARHDSSCWGSANVPR
jgi:hypothetical protein